MTQPLAHAVAVALATELGGGIRKSGRGWTVRCPIHQDKSPSLAITDGKCVPLVVHCHGGCRAEDVFAALVQRALLPDLRAGEQRGRRPLVTLNQLRLAQTTLSIWDRDRKRGLPITPADEAARKEARKTLALAKRFPPRAPVHWLIRLIEGEIRIDVGEACRGLPEARNEPLAIHWPPEVEAALIIDQGTDAEVLDRFARQCLRAGAQVVRVISGAAMDVYRAEVGHVE